MKKHTFACIFFFWALQHTYAQNLVVNSNFFEANNCSEFNQACSPAGWFCVPAGSEYYTPKFNIEPTYTLCGFVYYSSDSVNTRTWLTTGLLCPLMKDSVYIVEMDVLSKSIDKGKIGIYLPEDDFFYETAHFSTIVPACEYSNNGEAAPIPRSHWQKLQLRFTATGKERWLVIGNFTIDIPGDISTSYSGTMGSKYYYFIDNVAVRPAGKNVPLCSGADSVKQQLYMRKWRHSLLIASVDSIKRKKMPLVKADTITLPDILFEFNQFSLNKKFEKLLDSLTMNINQATVDSLLINGFTDNKGTDTYNKTLSINRAKAVAGYLTTKKGIPAGVCRIRGFGSSNAVAENTSSAGRLKNRRVEIIIFKNR
jgi:outer membrane protein OmpA-like peptidoglycan-associated protein